MEHFIRDLSILLVGAAVLSFLAVWLRQPIIMAYIACGILIGPWGLGWIRNVELLEDMSHLGITLLLFLAGLTLHPQKLLRIFRKTSLVTLMNCLVSFFIAGLFALAWQFSLVESLCIGMAMMFSSTILVIKLLPTTQLHHARIGAACIGVLIIEDLLAIAVLAFLRCLAAEAGVWSAFLWLSVKLFVFLTGLVLFEHYVLRRVMAFVDRLHEMIFMLGLAWCFGIANISHQMGLFYETGAFFAGVIMARHPIALFISEKLKPLRDFFLVLFFFTLGAALDLSVLKHILLPAVLLTLIFILFKPALFHWGFRLTGETSKFSREVGLRLGQLSEFSLLIALLALELGVIGTRASQLVQVVTIFSFVISGYLVVFRYPTPIGPQEQLIKD